MSNEEVHISSIPRLPTPGGGKRRPTAPLVNTSDESEEESSKLYANVPLAVNFETVVTCTDDEHLACPLSPSGSSTASGPTYERPPGFQIHGQEIISRPKLKKKKVIVVKGRMKQTDSSSPTKMKPRREPVPMRLRALPQSFWQQPNKPQPYSPATVYPVLPPLCKADAVDDSDIRPVTPPEENNNGHVKSCRSEVKVTVTNTDLLLFKLFEGVESEKKGFKDSTLLRRSRQKRSIHQHVQHQGKPAKTPIALLAGDDPFMVDAVSEKLFPQLSLENGKQNLQCGNSSLHLVTLKEGDRSVTLPSLSVDQNYSQMLSELVMHI